MHAPDTTTMKAWTSWTCGMSRGATRPASAHAKPRQVQESARYEAMRQLWRVQHQGAYCARMNHGGKGSQGATYNAQERRRITAIVHGATRQKKLLEHWIDRYTKRNVDPTMHVVLQVALYELHEGKVAEHALVHAGVELAKQAVRMQAGSMANAVLRAAIRERDALGHMHLPEVPKDEEDGIEAVQRRVAAWSIIHSHPTWMVQRWYQRYGMYECERLLQTNNQTHPSYGVRVANVDVLRAIPSNERTDAQQQAVDGTALLEACQRLGVQATPSTWFPNEFVRVERGLQKLLEAGAVREGGCAVQDEAAALAVAAMDPVPGDRVLDACAAPGGKALLAARRLKGQGSVTAVDVSAKKLRALVHAAEIQGVNQVVTTVASDFLSLPIPSVPYDKVLVDAPCSGTGVLAKRADLRWRRQEDDIPRMAELQRALLSHASHMVGVNGILVYSTCSLEPEENEEVVDAFLQQNSGFVLDPVPAQLPSLQVSTGILASLPHRHGSDGAFVARMKRVA